MFRFKSNITTNLFFGAVLLMAVVPAMSEGMRYAEQSLFPVVRDVKLDDVRQEDGGVSFRMSYRKARDCQYIGIAFFLKKPLGNFRMVGFTPPRDSGVNNPSSRPKGDYETDRWLLHGLSLSDMRTVTAFTTHRCHPLYETISRVFP